MSNTVGRGDEPITEGSGDVFADLGFADPGLARAKAELALQIHKTIRRRGWTQTKAAATMGIDQPKVSAIVRGRLSDFSPDRRVTCLDRLGRTVPFWFGTKPTSKRQSDPVRMPSGMAPGTKATHKRSTKKTPARA